jgi:hypothetical protein
MAITAITGETTVRDLLSSFPAAADILLRHGMCADCQLAPPPVPLAQFAKKHCHGNLVALLAELRSAGLA